MLANIQY